MNENKKTYELRFTWNDYKEACYRGKESHKQEGYLKVWQKDGESDKDFEERAKEAYIGRVRFIYEAFPVFDKDANFRNEITLCTFPVDRY